MYLPFESSDKKLIVSFILFNVTFFAVAMLALFIVIYTSDATELFQRTSEFLQGGGQIWGAR